MRRADTGTTKVRLKQVRMTETRINRMMMPAFLVVAIDLILLAVIRVDNCHF